ncbi:MAG: sel1 repeat family protein [Tannerellaceae bacterium]|nr:sel1 repeat family protein [Tannerellaceae bacterium]
MQKVSMRTKQQIRRLSMRIKQTMGIVLITALAILIWRSCNSKSDPVNVTKDYRYWYEKAEKQGDAYAQNRLGVCYYNGEGVTKDFGQAVHWFEKAEKQGYAYAQYNLGICYYNGNGVTKDYIQAVSWFRKAAEKGDDIAQYELGLCYENGEGVTKDDSQAAYWYKKAAELVVAIAKKDTKTHIFCR